MDSVNDNREEAGFEIGGRVLWWDVEREEN